MFEIRAIIQWNKDIKNDVGSWKSALVLNSCFLMLQSGTEWAMAGKKEGIIAQF